VYFFYPNEMTRSFSVLFEKQISSVLNSLFNPGGGGWYEELKLILGDLEQQKNQLLHSGSSSSRDTIWE
jgi:hypothetical protein